MLRQGLMKLTSKTFYFTNLYCLVPTKCHCLKLFIYGTGLPFWCLPIYEVNFIYVYCFHSFKSGQSKEAIEKSGKIENKTIISSNRFEVPLWHCISRLISGDILSLF